MTRNTQMSGAQQCDAGLPKHGRLALVLGGAACVHEDIEAAQKLLTADIIVAVKDIGITWPTVDYWATFHPERLPKELGARRKAGLPDPLALFTYFRRIPKGLGIPMRVMHEVKGGSSGMLGMEGALLVADKVVLCGIPLDPAQKHYSRPRKDGWPPAKMYRAAWTEVYPRIKDRVRSMSGWTRELLGAPTTEWLGASSLGSGGSE
jgi:hypothetical protein